MTPSNHHLLPQHLMLLPVIVTWFAFSSSHYISHSVTTAGPHPPPTYPTAAQIQRPS
nr:unnamed protein product [Digitaria exilis]